MSAAGFEAPHTGSGEPTSLMLAPVRTAARAMLMPNGVFRSWLEAIVSFGAGRFSAEKMARNEATPAVMFCGQLTTHTLKLSCHPSVTHNVHGLGDIGAGLVVPVTVRVDVGDLLGVLGRSLRGDPHVLPPLDVLPVADARGSPLLGVADEEDRGLDLGQAIDSRDVEDDEGGRLLNALALERGGQRCGAGNNNQRR